MDQKRFIVRLLLLPRYEANEDCFKGLRNLCHYRWNYVTSGSSMARFNCAATSRHLREGVTDLPTEGLTDTPSYRDATAHLKSVYGF